MYRILIVEDDMTIAELLAEHLRSWNYQAECARDFKRILENFVRFDPQLVILDIGLPFYNGFYWCQEIRRESKVPVVFLSSMSDNMNIVMAMNMGGDDFIAKPFDLNVLTAKLQAILRRCYDFSVQSPALTYGGVTLDPSEASLTYGGVTLELSRNEYRILLTLMERAGQVVSREKLMERLWETDSFVDENTLTVNIGRLRKKLESIGLSGFIVTRKGMGYALKGVE